MIRAASTPDATVRELDREGFAYGLPTIDLFRILCDFALDPASPE